MLGVAAVATAAAFLAASLPGAPGAPLAQIVLRLAVLGAVFLPAAVWLLRGDVREALRVAGLGGDAPSPASRRSGPSPAERERGLVERKAGGD